MIRTKSGMKPIYTPKTENDEKINGKDHAEASKQKETSNKESIKTKKSPDKSKKESKEDIPHTTKISPVKSKNERKAEEEIPQITNKKSPAKVKNETPQTSTKTKNTVENKLHTITSEKPKTEHIKTEKESEKTEIDTLQNSIWTEKYKPQKTSAIIGQHGDNSNLAKLKTWLQNWHRNHMGRDKPKLVKPSPWAKGDGGAYFKCALISGPPGVGKKN